MSNRASLEYLIDVFESYPDIRETAAKALVRRGREWKRRHPNVPKGRNNGVVVRVGAPATRSDLSPRLRVTAVWVLGEIGDRRAKPFVIGADGSDSMDVQREQTIALDKLGFTEGTRNPELFADGTYAETYNPHERGFIEETSE